MFFNLRLMTTLSLLLSNYHQFVINKTNPNLYRKSAYLLNNYGIIIHKRELKNLKIKILIVYFDTPQGYFLFTKRNNVSNVQYLLQQNNMYSKLVPYQNESLVRKEIFSRLLCNELFLSTAVPTLLQVLLSPTTIW